MKVGACTLPPMELAPQLRWLSENGFDYADIVCDAVLRYPDLESPEVGPALDRFDHPPIGHTCAYLPSAFPVEQVRAAASQQIQSHCGVLAAFRARKVVVHPCAEVPPFVPEEAQLAALRATLAEVGAAAARLGVAILLENMTGPLFGRPDTIASMLDEFPEMGFVLDLGHAQQHAGHTGIDAFVKNLSSRIQHVHAHDAVEGLGDSHLPIGDGAVDWPRVVRLLKGAGYDGTVTIEVFAGGKGAVLESRDRFKEYWTK